MPSAPVKLPFEAPDASPPAGGTPRSTAAACAASSSGRATSAGIGTGSGPRLSPGPPPPAARAGSACPGPPGPAPSALHALTSTHTLAFSWHRVRRRAALDNRGRDAGALGRARPAPARANTWWASSTVALTPSCGSTPAWAALPRTMSRKRNRPCGAIFSAPSGALGSQTRTAAQRRACSSISAREVPEPLSSSQVSRSPTRDASWSMSRAASICTIPAFMSHTPGPVARPSATANGHCPTVPAGQTVSKWPSSKIPPSGALPEQVRQPVPGSRCDRTAQDRLPSREQLRAGLQMRHRAGRRLARD